ncbi:MAG TPA: hypothetical protein VJ044_05985, partial [Candidatus Hodarchaeales archaeon]|nr:hypothetical protein [Candidatus Hodarchaeales archaeon]
EAIVITGGLTAGSGTAGVEKFLVTLTDSNQVAIFKKHMEEKTPIDFEFVRKGIYSWCSSSAGGDFVTKVQ